MKNLKKGFSKIQYLRGLKELKVGKHGKRFFFVRFF